MRRWPQPTTPVRSCSDMRALAALLVLAGAGLAVGAAAGDPVPLPPLTTVTVSVTLPPPPLPVPTLPAVTTAPAPAPAPAPSLPPLPGVGSTTPVVGSSGRSGSTGGSGSSGSSGGGTYAGSSTASGGTSASGSSSSSRVEHFHSSRLWIGTTGSKRRRTTTFTFVLPGAARVIFTINQASPACRGIGHFAVVAHGGLNRVRFSGRIHGKPLGPGTYRISARTAAGRLVRRITLVVVAGPAP